MEGNRKTAIVIAENMSMLANAVLLVKQAHDAGELTDEIIDILGMMCFITMSEAVIEPD